MDEARFLTLAEAFGSDLRRWPRMEQAAAARFAAAHPQIAVARLGAERRLDAALDGYAPAGPAAALRDRIIAAAPRERIRGRVRRWSAAAGLGLGMAASAAAGVAAGYTLGHPAVARFVAPTEADAGWIGSLADPAGDPADG